MAGRQLVRLFLEGREKGDDGERDDAESEAADELCGGPGVDVAQNAAEEELAHNVDHLPEPELRKPFSEADPTQEESWPVESIQNTQVSTA